MKLQAIIFDDEKDLQELTGLNHDQLWDSGFDLDDWDFGIVTDKSLTTQYADEFGDWASYVNYDSIPGGLALMFDACFCIRHVKYNGKHYTMAYHS